VQITALLCVRNEAAFLIEWLAHHRAAGIMDFVVYSNDCEDGTDAMLDRLAQLGWLEHHQNPGPYGKGGIQFTAMNRAARLKAVKSADWLLPLDVDEFVNVRVGDHTLPALIATLPEATAITLTWRLFGNADVVRYEDTPVTAQFTRAAPRILNWPWRATMFKTLYRNDGTYAKPGVHRPRDPDPDRIDAARWYGSDGQPLDPSFARQRLFSGNGRDHYALAQLNHYPLGAMESYVLKAARGRAVHSDHALGLDYWVERNYATDEDTTIAALAPAAGALRTELMADPELARLHSAAVAWRKQRFEALMREEPYRALFGRLLQTPPSRPVPAAAARFMFGYATAARSTAEDQG
jgi:hypothetical protein